VFKVGHSGACIRRADAVPISGQLTAIEILCRCAALSWFELRRVAQKALGMSRLNVAATEMAIAPAGNLPKIHSIFPSNCSRLFSTGTGTRQEVLVSAFW